MKKFFIFILMVAAGYFAYEYLIKEKPVLEIDAQKQVTIENSLDPEAPVLYPPKYGSIQGTVKNISDHAVTNIVLKYQLEAKPVEAVIDRLEPGEQKKFSTQTIMIRNSGAQFFLEEMAYQ